MPDQIEFYTVQSNHSSWTSVPFYSNGDPSRALREAEALRDRLGAHDYTVVGSPYTYAGQTPQTLQEIFESDTDGLLDSPADDEIAADGWTWGELRAIGEAIGRAGI